MTRFWRSRSRTSHGLKNPATETNSAFLHTGVSRCRRVIVESFVSQPKLDPQTRLTPTGVEPLLGALAYLDIRNGFRDLKFGTPPNPGYEAIQGTTGPPLAMTGVLCLTAHSLDVSPPAPLGPW